MYKISVKKLKNGGFQVDKETEHANGIEALTAIDSIICDIENYTGLSYRKIIKYIKETRKCIETEDIIENDNFDNTNE